MIKFWSLWAPITLLEVFLGLFVYEYHLPNIRSMYEVMRLVIGVWLIHNNFFGAEALYDLTVLKVYKDNEKSIEKILDWVYLISYSGT